ncbi:MAG: hypothetical protein IT582_01280 [Opitutaceae bacterium]|nr:hypothetical protein [Opitutaceae bacterium]
MNKTWKVIVAFLGVFIAGGVIGGVLSLRLVREHARERRTMDRFEPMAMKRYVERLGLTDEQRARVREIVRATDTELRRLRGEGFKATVAAGEEMNTRIEQLLTAEQKVRLEKIKQEMRERWRRERQTRILRADRPADGGPPGEPASREGPRR